MELKRNFFSRQVGFSGRKMGFSGWKVTFQMKRYLFSVHTISLKFRPSYHTSNEGPVRIQYKCMVPIYVFPQMKLVYCATSLFLKQNYNVLSPNSYTHISARDLYISRISLSILLQPNMLTDPGKIYSISHECGNWDNDDRKSFAVCLLIV